MKHNFRYALGAIAALAATGLFSAANGATYNLGYQEPGYRGGAVTFVSGGPPSITTGTPGSPLITFGDFRLQATASMPQTYPGVLTLALDIATASTKKKTLNVFETANGLTYKSIDGGIGLRPDFVAPADFSSDPVLGNGGLPPNWSITDTVYFSSANATLGSHGQTTGFVDLGSVTFTSSEDGVVTVTSNTLQSVTETISGPYSLILETSVYAATKSGSHVSTRLNASVSSVPEPATWAMLALGFVGVGYAGLSRRKRGRVAV